MSLFGIIPEEMRLPAQGHTVVACTTVTVLALRLAYPQSPTLLLYSEQFILPDSLSCNGG